MRLAWPAALVAAAALAACSTVGPIIEPSRPLETSSARPAVTPAQPGFPVHAGTPLSALPGWAEDDHRAAFEAFRTTCGRLPELAGACASARVALIRTPAEARTWWEARFTA